MIRVLLVLMLSLSPSAVIAADVLAKITTDHGVIAIRLFHDKTPRTVSSFVTLARQGFYAGTVFHRVVPGFVVQGGDPLGTGAGGPGYCFADEVVPELKHAKAGMVSMANTGPDTNGSQFFITLAPVPTLDGKHTVFGEVVDGHAVLDKIAAVKTKASRPVQDVKIIKIDVTSEYAPGPVDKIPTLKESELEGALKSKVEDLVAKVGDSLGLGKPGAITFESSRVKCADAQASYRLDFASSKSAKLLVFGRATPKGFDIRQFQFAKGNAP